MRTIEEILSTRTRRRQRPNEEELRRLPDRKAVIQGRLSGFTQVRESKESVREIASLVALAKHDGYKTGLDLADVERWLEKIQGEIIPPGLLEDGEVIVNCLGLGVSGTLPEMKRPDLTVTMELLKKGELGAIYVTEGANRLSRDPDRVVSSTLLKLMKDTNCKLRTPSEVLSPRIERDWEIIHDELEEAAEELKRMQKRLHRRKVQKAGRGEFVGEPIPAGFVLPIVRRRPNGKYEFGKMQPYPPHAEVDVQILREFVRQRGSKLKTVQALGDLTYPHFPEELAYMERLSVLRVCRKTPTGYAISRKLVEGLATNPKLIGVWLWGDGDPIPDHHDPAVPKDLFIAAYELATRQGKPKGRAVHHEPLEWAGILWCCNHPGPEPVSSHPGKGEYCCQRDYLNGRGAICLNIQHRFIDEPLTAEVLRQLDFTPYAGEVLANLEAEAVAGKVEETQRQREVAELERRMENLKAYLGCGDPSREEVYWEQFNNTKQQLEALRAKPNPKRTVVAADIERVRDFLAGLTHNWDTYPRTLRNQLLSLLIDRVELRHRGLLIDASIIWKAGFEQHVAIRRPMARGSRDKRWTEEEQRLLSMLWPSSSEEVLQAVLPGRTWRAITNHAHYRSLKRQRTPVSGDCHRPWVPGEEAKAKALYEAGTPVDVIVAQVDRTRDAILNRAADKGWKRPASAKWKKAQVTWEADNLKVLQGQSCSQGEGEIDSGDTPQVPARRGSPLLDFPLYLSQK